jgi:hypothetical protein
MALPVRAPGGHDLATPHDHGQRWAMQTLGGTDHAGVERLATALPSMPQDVTAGPLARFCSALPRSSRQSARIRCHDDDSGVLGDTDS